MKLAFSGTVIAALLVAPAALGQSAQDRETARHMFDEGKAARDRGDAAGALEAFRAADALMNVPTTKLALARAHLVLGHLVEARNAALAVALIPLGASESKPFSDARVAAAKLALEVADRIPSVRVTWSGATPDALAVDDEDVPRAAWAAARRVNPGRHVITARVGERRVREEVKLAEKDQKTVTLATPVLDRPDAPAPAENASASTPPADAAAAGATAASITGTNANAETSFAPPADGGRPLGGLFWSGVALTAAGVAVGTFAGLTSMAKKSEAAELCRDDRCPPPAHDSVDAAKTWATVSTIGFGAAAAGIGLGVLGLALRPSSARLRTASVRLQPTATGFIGRF